MTTTHICICGGGSLAHVCAGVLASRPDTQVNILTRHPQDWAERITVTDPDGRIYEGAPATVSADAREALQGCTLVLLCLPGFAIRETLERIRPHIGPAVAVGSIVSSTGFFFAAHSVLDADTPLFGFQRVPYIARTGEYGRSALLLGYKPELAVAIEHTPDAEALRALLEKLWSTPTRLLGSHYEASLTNSNPILHTGRLYTLWSQWHGEVSERPILFYREWTDDASRLLLDMDAEFMQLLQVLPVGKHAIPSLLDYYECSDAESLTRKIQSIPAFSHIVAPMKQVDGGWVPDFASRYFTEDFPYGLRHIVDTARLHHVETPTLDRVFAWGTKMIREAGRTPACKAETK